MCVYAVLSDAHLPGPVLFGSAWRPGRRALLIWRQSQENVPWWGQPLTYPNASCGVAGQQHLAGHEGPGADRQASAVHHAQGRGQLCQVAPQLLL